MQSRYTRGLAAWYTWGMPPAARSTHVQFRIDTDLKARLDAGAPQGMSGNQWAKALVLDALGQGALAGEMAERAAAGRTRLT